MKMTKMKKILSLVLSVIMLLGVIPAGVITAGAADSDFGFKVSDGQVKVTSCNISASGDIVVPAEYNGNPVTEIGVGAFLNCTKIRSISIPDSVNKIGNKAFSGCTALEKVTIGKGVTSLGNELFLDCDSLDKIVVSADNAVYSSDADGVLYNKAKTAILLYPVANSATTYTVSDKVEKIADGTFFMSQKVKTIVIGDNVKEIGHNAFMGSRSLETVKIGKGVERILGNQAFNDCEKLTSITVDSGNKIYSSDSDGILYNKGKTEILRYPEGISKTAFTVPSGIEAIRTSSFRSAVNLKTVSFPKSLKTIDASAFTGCTSITEVNYAGKEDEWNKITIGNDNNAILSAKIVFAGGETHEHKYTSTVTKAPTCSEGGVKTYSCTCGHKYTEPIAPSGHVFSNNKCTSCNTKEYVLVADGTYAKITGYNGAGGAVVVPEKIEGYTINAIGDNAFENKSAVVSVKLPANIVEIGNNAFYKTGYYNTAANWEGNVLYIGNYLIQAKDTLSGSYTVKDGTTLIADFAFASAKSLTSITLPAETLNIGDYAFSGCTALSAVTVNAVESEWKTSAVVGIGNASFQNATFTFKIVPHVHDFVVTEETPATCTTAGYRKSACTCGEKKDEVLAALGHIFVNNVCTGCGERQFNITISGDTVTITGCHPSLSGVVTIPATIGGYKVTAIGDRAFYKNGRIEKLVLPAGLETIGKMALTASGIVIELAAGNTHFIISDGIVYNNARTELVYCPVSKGAKTITVLSGVITIAEGAFYGCSAIETINLPRTLKTISNDAFSGCTAIKNVIFEGTSTQWKKVTVAEGNSDFLKAGFTYRDVSDVAAAKDIAANLDITGAEVTHDASDETIIIITAKEEATAIEIKATDKRGNKVEIKTEDTNITGEIGECYFLTFNGWHKSGNKTETEITVNGNTYIIKFVFPVGENDGHVYGAPTEKEATCTAAGGTEYKCIICEYSYIDPDESKPVLGHKFSAWVIEKDETCTEEGEKQRVCSRCGEVQTGTVPPSGVHSYTKTVTAPTCIEKGYTTYTCSCGDTYKGNETPATGHDFAEFITKEAKCEETGEKVLDCKACDFAKTVAIPATGHTYDEGVVTKAPKCEETGEKTLTCEICASTKTEVVSAIGHKYDKVTVYPPTESSQGYTEHACVNEGCKVSYRDNIVPSLASIKSVNVQDVVVYKNKTYTVVPALDYTGTPNWTATYEIADESIISIDKNGMITGLKQGKTSVKCIITDESGKTVQDTFIVEVKLSVWQWIEWFFVDFIFGGLKDFFSSILAA